MPSSFGTPARCRATAGNRQGEFVVLAGDRLTGGKNIKFALNYLMYQSRKNNPQRQIEHRTAKFVFSTDNLFSPYRAPPSPPPPA